MRIKWTLIILLFSLYASAQLPQGADWQWAHAMGSNYDHNTIQGWNESIVNTVEDKQGNYYVLANCLNKYLIDDDTVFTGYGPMFGYSAILIKFDCNGQIQWQKMMGATVNQVDVVGLTLIYDEKNDGVYMKFRSTNDGATYLGNQFGHADTVFTAPQAPNRKFYWASYSNAGSLRWLRPDFHSPMHGSPAYQHVRTIPNDGIYVHMNSSFAAGIDSPVVLNHDTLQFRTNYWVKYDEDLNYLWSKKISEPWPTINGNPLGVNDLAISPDGYVYMVGQLYAPNDDSTLINDTLYTADGGYRAVLVKMDLQGDVKWVKVSDAAYIDGLRRIVISKQGRIYVMGNAQRGSTNMFGYSVQAFGGTYIHQNYIIEIDSNANLINGINADYKIAEANSMDMIDHNGSIYYAGAAINDSIFLDGRVLYRIGDSHSCKITKLDPDLNILWTKYIMNDDNNSPGNKRMRYQSGLVNEQGNVLIYGEVHFAFNLDSVRRYNNHGGAIDNFMAQFGVSCTSSEAIIAPLEPTELIANGTGLTTIDVSWHDNANYEHGFYIYRSNTQNGTYSLIDSVLSNVSNYQNINLQQSTTYWYKVAAYNSSGVSYYTNIDSARTADTTIVSINEVVQKGSLTIAPNPFAEHTTISFSDNLTGSEMVIYDVTGRRVKSIKLNGSAVQLSNDGMSSGSYYYEVEGRKDKMKYRGSITVQ